MKNLSKFSLVIIMSLAFLACKQPSTGAGATVVDEVASVESSTDASGNTTTTTTAADGRITTTITSADGTSVTTVALPADVDNTGSAAGVWRGVFTPSDSNTQATFYKVMISPSNRVVMLSESGSSLEVQASDMMSSTSFAQTSDGITINLEEYKKENAGAAPEDVEIVGNLTPKDNIKGTYTKGAETGSFIFIYDPIYENDEQPFFYTQDSVWSLSKTTRAEKYEVVHVIGESVGMVSTTNDMLGAPFSIDEDGNNVLNPLPENATADTQGCVYDSNISIVDPNFVIYNITMKVTDCALAGEYTGLATLEERFSLEDHPHDHYNFMTFGVSDGSRTINNRLTYNLDWLRT